MKKTIKLFKWQVPVWALVVMFLVVGTAAAAFSYFLSPTFSGSAKGVATVYWTDSSAICNLVGLGTCTPSQGAGPEFEADFALSGVDDDTTLSIEVEANNQGSSAVCISSITSTDPNITVTEGSAGPFSGETALDVNSQGFVRWNVDLSGITPGYDFSGSQVQVEWTQLPGGGLCP